MTKKQGFVPTNNEMIEMSKTVIGIINGHFTANEYKKLRVRPDGTIFFLVDAYCIKAYNAVEKITKKAFRVSVHHLKKIQVQNGKTSLFIDVPIPEDKIFVVIKAYK